MGSIPAKPGHWVRSVGVRPRTVHSCIVRCSEKMVRDYGPVQSLLGFGHRKCFAYEGSNEVLEAELWGRFAIDSTHSIGST